jgi:hypothetical protein
MHGGGDSGGSGGGGHHGGGHHGGVGGNTRDETGHENLTRANTPLSGCLAAVGISFVLLVVALAAFLVFDMAHSIF